MRLDAVVLPDGTIQHNQSPPTNETSSSSLSSSGDKSRGEVSRHVSTYSPSVMSVPAPKELAPPIVHSVDTLQDLITRKREAAKNKYKFHLTEGDCKLVLTNAKETTYTSGSIIFEEGRVINAMYRVKSGKIFLMKQGHKLFELHQGYWIGEGLLIRGEEASDIFGAQLVASGQVTLSEVNLPFLQQLLAADNVLAFKVYRTIASKLAALLYSVIGSVLSTDPPTVPLPPPSPQIVPGHAPPQRQDSFSSSDSNPSDLASDSSGSGSSGTGSGNSGGVDLKYPPKSVIMSEEMANMGRGRKKLSGIKKCKRSSCGTTTPYKVYNLESNGTVKLDENMLTVVTRGHVLKNKRKIKYNKILDVAKTGAKIVTIIYDMQAKTIFFQKEEERNEFFGIIQSFLTASGKSPEASPALSPSVSLSSIHSQASDKEYLKGMATTQSFKKGDIIVAEGDLYQRVYTVVEGKVNLRSHGRVLVQMDAGEVFGILTLFHLRPSRLTIDVVSDTCTVLIIPVYKFTELFTTNFPLAVRMHKCAAQHLYTQIGNALQSREGTVIGFSEAHMFL